MNYYLAPMEGITGYIYRTAYHQCFGYIDKYFTPFITPNQTHKLTSREQNDILPEHNRGMMVVPQILTNKAEDFIWGARRIQELGYKEVNLNLGCPSGTVVAKGRGSGFLTDPYKLQVFLDQVSNALVEANMGFSIKTRIGRFDSEEFPTLLTIFNQLPLKELVIHPRVQTDFYNNQPNLEAVQYGISQSKNPVCYNGDLFSKDHYMKFINQFPTVERVMIGRGIIADPGLIEELVSEKTLEKPQLKKFHDIILDGYISVIDGDRNVLFKMKELWHYMGPLFIGGEKIIKKIKKSSHLSDYNHHVFCLFSDYKLVEYPGFLGWKQG